MNLRGLMVLATLLLMACSKQVASEGTAESNSSTSPPKSQAAAQSAQSFWVAFRGAALAKDRAALLALTRFPFITRGATDGDPSVSHDRAAFERILPQILDQDTGLNAAPQTVRQYLESHPSLPTIAMGGGQSQAVAADATQFAAGPLNFQKVNDRWYWTSAYLEE